MLTPLFNRARRLLTEGRSTKALTPEDFHQMRLTGSVEYLAGAVTLTLATLVPDADTSDHSALLVLALIGVLLSALRYTAPQRLAVVRASILVGFVYIASIVAVATPVGPTPFFFLWPMLTTAYFLGRRDLAAYTAGFSLALLIGLLGNGGVNIVPVMFGPTFSVVLIASLLVLAVRERVDGLMGDLAYTASTDMLTDLPNRRTFEAACDAAIERSRRSKAPMSLAIIDLDHFKAINDRLGHAEGDRALRRFATILREQCRAVDFPARIGGEEFAVVLGEADGEQARILAEALLARVKEATAHDPAPLSVSIGITELHDASDTQDVLLLAADRALYEAKNTGRGKVVVAVPVPEARAMHTGHRLELLHSAPLPPAA
ncbi:MAG: GGDEF domain-containing protein [Solirubrobacteraceae bacterium]|nr:GGDEF domain-containing protein [Solirubrobacteraceae bacterium]